MQVTLPQNGSPPLLFSFQAAGNPWNLSWGLSVNAHWEPSSYSFPIQTR